MKKIFIHADKNFSQELKTVDSLNNYEIKLFNSKLQPADDVAFFVIDADSKNINIPSVINTYKKFKTKFWAYTKNPDKNNILRLYEMGFDNVIPYPENICNVLENMTHPDNADFTTEEIKNYSAKKKVLIISDCKNSIDVLTEALNPSEFIHTVKPTANAGKNEFKKDNYNLVIFDCKTPSADILKTTEIITSNYNTPFIFIAASQRVKDKLEAYKAGALCYIDKPCNAQILQIIINQILEIKALQENISKENQVLDSLISNSISQPIITDANFVVLGGGTQYIELNKGEQFFNFFRSHNINLNEDAIRSFERNNLKTLKFNFEYNNKYFETIISKVYTQKNLLEQYVITIEDVTEKLIIEEQKETFIATLTHDLKSPIRAEQLVLTQLLDEKFGTLNDTQREIIAEILKSREYTKRMLDNLLTRYKTTSASIEITKEKNSYKKAIETAVLQVSQSVIEKKQEINVDYNAQTEEFEFDKTEINRVLVNILANASEYTPKLGKIRVSVWDTNTEIITEISDNGYGIEDKDLAFIFDKNVTLAKKYRKVGVGLGLYISKTLINAHGGNISVRSKVNEGTTFRFTLPTVSKIKAKEKTLKQ